MVGDRAFHRSHTIKAMPNNGLHQTGRGGVAFRSMRPVVEARPAGEAGCCTGLKVWQQRTTHKWRP